MEKSNLQILTNGIIKENPVLVLVLGTCPTLAVTTMAKNGIGMGLAATFVLLGSNIVISLLKKVIPDKVRIPCFIVVIAGFVTLLSSLLQAYVPDVYSSLGIFLPLIVVNCIILGRAEMFASKNSVFKSALDGIGMGIGFTLALLVIGSIREILGSGTWFGIPITANLFEPISIFVLAPGGFLVFGCVIALLNKVSNGKAVKRKSFGCESCPNAAGCANAGKGGCE
ncbi:electron transport complex subunit E [uncultured Negativibacillus sp.]|uniref:electron transport complex subunit RsxE n=1 Tax=uncultured Negativibacillus sp. TaxID=1980696 RepID=UPI0025ED0FBB|nr:electron transport complex subunit E [uncultured Negativibacillus sp.]